MRLRAAIFGALLAHWHGAPAMAQSPVEATLGAINRLGEARAGLAAAQDADNRVGALTGVVLAYEAGLAALRDAERKAALVRLATQADLDRESAELARLLAALQSAGGSANSVRIVHPEGALAAARAAMLMAEVVPALDARAAGLRDRIAAIDALMKVGQTARAALDQGRSEVGAARLALTQVLRSRADAAPARDSDAAVFAALSEAGAGLEDFALALVENPVAAAIAGGKGFADALGQLAPPVAGAVLRAFGAQDAAGIARPGVVFATRPQALITAPWPSTLRYTGSLNGYGNVMILEIAPGYLVILTGMEQSFGAPGQVLPLGAPLGLMGGTESLGDDAASGRGETLTETLYVETRRDGHAQDPATWFALDKERN